MEKRSKTKSHWRLKHQFWSLSSSPPPPTHSAGEVVWIINTTIQYLWNPVLLQIYQQTSSVEGANSIRSSSHSNQFQWPRTGISLNDKHSHGAVAGLPGRKTGAYHPTLPHQVSRGQPSLPPWPLSLCSSFLQGRGQKLSFLDTKLTLKFYLHHAISSSLSLVL